MLSILVIGGGIGGLACALALRRSGHAVRILESSSWAIDSGAAFTIPPNSSRTLKSLGFDLDQAGAVRLKRAVLHKDVDKEPRPGPQELPLSSQLKFADSPYYMMHRWDLREKLWQMCSSSTLDLKGRAVEVSLRTRVVDVDVEVGEVKCEDGTTYSADLLIAADGVHSTAHEHVVGRRIATEATGLHMTRFTLLTKSVLDDPQTAPVLDEGDGSFCVWRSADNSRSFLKYPCRNNELQNFCAYISPLPSEYQDASNPFHIPNPSKSLLATQTLTMPSEIQALNSHLSDSDLYLWTVREREPLPSLTKDKLVLLGDAAHPMRASQGQGASQAIEDGAVLGVLLEGVDSAEEVRERLKVYDAVRVPRCARVQLLSRVSLVRGGIEESQRKELKARFGDEDVPSTSEELVKYMWSYNCIDVARAALASQLGT